MKWTSWLFPSLVAALIAGCGGDRRHDETGAAAGTGTESGSMQGGATGAATDTSMRAADSAATQPGAGAMTADSAGTGSRIHSDSNSSGAGASGTSNANQTKSGVTDTRTGKSTLGKGVTQTRPDQNQPVTSKGDTLRSGGDSTSQ
jgi:hypothetical protein